MDNNEIKTLLSDIEAENRAIEEATYLVKSRGIDGVNLDFEYLGNPGEDYPISMENRPGRMRLIEPHQVVEKVQVWSDRYRRGARQ